MARAHRLRTPFGLRYKESAKSEDLKQMEHFLATNVESKKTGKKLTRTFQTALDLARANINWVRKNARVIQNWLDNKLAHADDAGANGDAPAGRRRA
ncbi:hypothetical protein MTO96_047187 [Rhipicephalus appendiculatus]